MAMVKVIFGAVLSKQSMGSWTSGFSKEVITPYGVSLWRAIRSFWPSMVCQTEIKVNNGNNTMFWTYRWLSNTNFKALFPDTFSPTL